MPNSFNFYTLSWKECEEAVLILFDREDNAKILDEFFMFVKAERSKADTEKSPKDGYG